MSVVRGYNDDIKYKKFISKFNNFEGCEERNDLPDEELDSTKYKIALCGKCKYNHEIKQFHIENFRPYCLCICETRNTLQKCSIFQKDNSGIELEGKVCPPGYFIEVKHYYNIMIFVSPIGKSSREIMLIKMNSCKDYINMYRKEINRLNSLYNSLSSKIYNTFTRGTSIRYLKVKDLEDNIEKLSTIIFSLSIELKLFNDEENRE